MLRLSKALARKKGENRISPSFNPPSRNVEVSQVRNSYYNFFVLQEKFLVFLDYEQVSTQPIHSLSEKLIVDYFFQKTRYCRNILCA